MRRVNEEQTSLLSIGEFGRRSSLSISALRFYGDCGVLVPARIDSATGYRYYSQVQIREAELVRNLRALEMPIAEIQSFLIADLAAAEALLDQHWHRLQRRLDRNRRALSAVQSLLRSKETTMSATTRLEGSQFASAIRQVLPAGGPLGPDSRYPAAILIEVRGDGLRLAATDGHRLAVRDLPARTEELGKTVISVDDAGEVASIVDAAGPVTLTAGRGLSVEARGKTIEMSAASDHYPDYEAILGRCGTSKLLVKSEDLLARLHQARDLIVLSLRRGETSADGVPFSGRYDGADLRIGFNPVYLAEGVAAGIGPDAILQLGGPLDPVMIRSADDGTLTWLVMPVRLKERAAI
jgi:DNA-binding transcriptional MerR regulator